MCECCRFGTTDPVCNIPLRNGVCCVVCLAQVKRDIFDKVQGAVRDTKMVYASGFYYKVFIATVSTMAEQNFETSLLQVRQDQLLLSADSRVGFVGG